MTRQDDTLTSDDWNKHWTDLEGGRPATWQVQCDCCSKAKCQPANWESAGVAWRQRGSRQSWGSDMEAQTECRPSVEMPTCVLVVQREDDVRHDMDPNVDMQCYIT